MRTEEYKLSNVDDIRLSRWTGMCYAKKVGGRVGTKGCPHGRSVDAQGRFHVAPNEQSAPGAAVRTAGLRVSIKMAFA